jgi:hypothetical protein
MFPYLFILPLALAVPHPTGRSLLAVHHEHRDARAPDHDDATGSDASLSASCPPRPGLWLVLQDSKPLAADPSVAHLRQLQDVDGLYDAMAGTDGHFLRQLHLQGATSGIEPSLLAGSLLGSPGLTTLALRDVDLSRAGDAAAIAAALEHLPVLIELR